jgi:hypothetical protein
MSPVISAVKRRVRDVDRQHRACQWNEPLEVGERVDHFRDAFARCGSRVSRSDAEDRREHRAPGVIRRRLLDGVRACGQHAQSLNRSPVATPRRPAAISRGQRRLE